MPDAGERLHGFLESTWRIYSFFSEWICSLTFRQSADPLVRSPSSSYFKLVRGQGHHCSGFSNRMEPIDISSSDSDFDSDDDLEVEAIPSPEIKRRLPNWSSVSRANTGASSSRGSISGGKSSFAMPHSQTEPGPSTSYDIDANFRFPEENGSTFQSKRYDADIRRNNSTYAQDAEYQQQSLKRTLPPSLQPPGMHTKQNSFWDNLGRNHGGDNNGGFYHPVSLSVSNSRSHGKDNFGWAGDEDLHNRSHILPHGLVRGKPSSSGQYALSDPFHNMGFGEERVSGDERLIFQAALQDLSQPKAELDIPNGLLSVPLLRHQKIALAWMVQKESRTVHCLGGILADDQGLGKTISTIALIQKQRSLQKKSQSKEHDNQNAEALDLDDDDDNKNGSANEALKKNGDLDNAYCKLDKACIDKSEILNLDDDESGSASTVAVQKTKDLDRPKCKSVASSSRQTFQRQRPAAGTLIVCPATVLRQWARELDDKVAEEGKLSVLVYHGGNRTKDPTELAKYDVVVTTYSIVSNEVPRQPIVDEDDVEQKAEEKYGLSSEFTSKKRKPPSAAGKKGKKGRKLVESSMYSPAGALARVSWFRVVLDEAQTIKNHRTQTARACCGLRAKRRWCLSGTPIQNSVDELYSYFRFLRHDLYSSYKTFCEAIKIPISRDPNMGYKKLQAVLKTLLLRRTKETLLDGQPIINLPPKVINMKTVNFTVEERSFYAQLEAESRSQFKAYAAAGTVNQNYANILLMILRLRQACDHPLLVKGFDSYSARKTNMEKARKLPQQRLMDLLTKLEAPSVLCEICNDPAEDAAITICGHVFCYQCVAEYISTGEDNICPGQRCRVQLSDDVLFSEATLRSCLLGDVENKLLNDSYSSKSSSILSSEYSSSKIKAVLEILLSHHKSNNPCIELDGPEDDADNSLSKQVRIHKTENSSSQGPIKTIVFSQWTRMLDLFEFSLNQHCIQYRRLDGSMSLAARDRAVREFSTDAEVTVMLMSLKAGNLGLNMVAACHVILLDLWWNPTTEDQAIDRAHRIGQTRPVTVSRITIKDTVEDRILALQEEKRKMVASAFGEDRVGVSATRLTVDDLRYLFLGSRGA